VSVLWVLPLLIFAGGAVLILTATRRAAQAGARLRAECSRLDDLRTELVDLRIETGATQATLDRLHSRSVSGATQR
jgi:hypothetical protein